MKLLAIETSAQALSLALQVEENIFSHHSIVPMQQAQLILPEIKKLLEQADIKLQELDAIAFGQGPGSFTGIRIAAGVAQGLSFGANLPVIAVSSLAALAQEAYQTFGWEKLLVAVDARMQEIYFAAYCFSSAAGVVELIDQEQVLPPSQLPVFTENSWVGIGNAWDVYEKEFPYKPLKINTTFLPTATALLSLAKIKWLKKETLTSEQALPSYLRMEVAKKSNKIKIL